MEIVTGPGKATGRMDAALDPAVIAADLSEVRRLYEGLFAGSLEGVWDASPRRGSDEWTLHEAIAHQCALNGAGLESVRHTLRGEPYSFVGLDDRYAFNAYNRRGIDEHLGVPRDELCAAFLGVLDDAATIARDLSSDHAALDAQMPIYNRRVRIDEVLSIIILHAGLVHTAQVAEPAGLPPLWTLYPTGIRHRLVTRTTLALSLLYRHDIGGSLEGTIAFRIDGFGGGEWYVAVSPTSATFGEGRIERPSLVIHLRDTAVFCQMLTGRLHLPVALLTRRMKLHGDLRLFLRMETLFSEDARPKGGGDRRIGGSRAARRS